MTCGNSRHATVRDEPVATGTVHGMAQTTSPNDAVPTGDLSAAQAAALLNVTQRTVLRWVAEGRIPAYRLSARCVRIRREDLDRVRSGGAPP